MQCMLLHALTVHVPGSLTHAVHVAACSDRACFWILHTCSACCCMLWPCMFLDPSHVQCMLLHALTVHVPGSLTRAVHVAACSDRACCCMLWPCTFLDPSHVQCMLLHVLTVHVSGSFTRAVHVAAKLPPKTDSEDNAGACRPLSLRHRCWIQRLNTIVALLRIVLAFLVSVKQRRGPKRRPHRVQQITTPTGSKLIPNAYNGYLRIPDPQRWSRIIVMTLVLLLPSCYWKNIKMKQNIL